MTIFLLFVLVIVVLGLAVGVLEMVFKHQRLMAGIWRNSSDKRVEALERRVEELTQLVYQQTIAMDGVAPRKSADPIQERVGA